MRNDNKPIDIIEELHAMNVDPVRQIIINSAADEILKLRAALWDIKESITLGSGKIPIKDFDPKEPIEKRCTENGMSIALCVVLVKMEELGLI